MWKNQILFIMIGLGIVFLANSGIKYIMGQEDNNLGGSINDTKRVSEILTPDSKNESRFNSEIDD